MENFDIIGILKTLPAVIIGLTIHEFAHAWTAFKLGDKTAGEMGRLSFNPLKHIDPLGFLFILLAGFGWAKPVMINPSNLKKPHRDEILISIAGPASNLIFGFIIIIATGLIFRSGILPNTTGAATLVNILIIIGWINLSLFIFNMIPIPPLDGSHIYLTFLKVHNPLIFENMYKYGTGILFLILIAESQFKLNILPIGEVTNFLTQFALRLAGIQ